ANRNNIIIMKDGEGVADSLKKMAQVLKKGRSVIIFPEGTRTRDGMLNEFKQSFSLLACELNIPVVPVAIKGAYEAFPKGRKMPHPFKRVDVEYLPHITPEGYTKDELAYKVKRSIERVLERNQ
ncbi:MAG TPA: 1-acyl-sn-glycerol-3-phosphate acyltransferase, partial [bacterium]|nr:1-acyl-sn-glycerol-3-phosphate acyltransferase [bacterium]